MKVSIICVISIDGYLNPKVDMSPTWSSAADKQFFVDETKRSGVMIMGNNTFKHSFHEKAMPDRWSVVLTPQPKDETENIWFTNDEPQAILDRIAAKGYKEVSVVGGSMINSLFLDAGLVTDLYITVAPIAFGSGVPLFAKLQRQHQFELADSRPLGPGEVLMHYTVIS